MSFVSNLRNRLQNGLEKVGLGGSKVNVRKFVAGAETVAKAGVKKAEVTGLSVADTAKNLTKAALGGAEQNAKTVGLNFAAMADASVSGAHKAANVVTGAVATAVNAVQKTPEQIKKDAVKLALSLPVDVRTIQWMIDGRLECDGIVGSKTKAAIKEYQKENKLPITGKLDNATVTVLAEKDGYMPDCSEGEKYTDSLTAAQKTALIASHAELDGLSEIKYDKAEQARNKQ